MKNKDILRERAEDLIGMSEGETTIKTYHCTTVNNGEYEGFITLTDRRMILVETSARGKDCRKSELPLEAVGGIDYQFRHGANGGKIGAGIFFLLACIGLLIVPFLHTFAHTWINWIFWGGSGVCFVLSMILLCLRSPALFVITIYSSYPMTNFLGFVSTSKNREERLFIKPALDCMTMIRELGALVLDIRQYGAQVREKYLNKSEQKELRVERREEEKRVIREREIEEGRMSRLEEKQRRQRIKDQQRLEKECRKSKKDEPSEEKDEQYFDILNK